MKDAKSNIILYLSQNYDWVTAKEVSLNTNISTRSVKYYVKLINGEVRDAVLSSNKGYKINRMNINNIMNTFMNEHAPMNYLERKKYILRELLISNNAYSLNELADDLFISTATLQNELSRIRCELLPRKIKLHIRKDIVTITGEKEAMQKYYLELVKGEVQSNLFQTDSIQQMFDVVDLKIIEKALKEELNKTQYFLDNYSMMSMILHIALMIEFKNRNLTFEDETNISPIKIKEHVTQAVVSVFQNLQNYYEFDYTPGDIFETSLLLMSKLVYQTPEEINEKAIRDYVGEDVENLLNYIMEKVKRHYAIDLNNQKFIVRFAFHLQKLLLRCEQGLDSSFTNSFIKNDYPMMYSLATYIAYLITKKTTYVIPEDEIAYIALHIGVSIDEDYKEKDKLSCVIFSPDYYLLGESIYEKLESTFKNYLNITAFVTTYMELETINDADLIISTAQLPPNIGTHITVINRQITFDDIQNIYASINAINRSNKKREIVNLLDRFNSRNLFFYDIDARTDSEVIDFLCAKMQSQKLVSRSFRKSIYERESVSKSCYGNIAIPHPLNNTSKVSSIAISIHPTPVKWGDNDVNLVIMLSISEQDNNLFSKVFDIIAKPISDDQVLQQLLTIDNYDDFIDYLTNNS
ncbi:MAG: PTS sugar transporter subunit IIA [Erysipelotrichaceae bacterium]|nr:PTS sugar transporter subunit IIA [Erysipelotrichaceae bacterium]